MTGVKRYVYQQVVALAEALADSGATIPDAWITQAVLTERAKIEGADRDWHLLITSEDVFDIVAAVRMQLAYRTTDKGGMTDVPAKRAHGG